MATKSYIYDGSQPEVSLSINGQSQTIKRGETVEFESEPNNANFKPVEQVAEKKDQE
jgi:hypothetical protein